MWIKGKQFDLEGLLSLSASNPEIDQEDFKKTQVSVVEKAIDDNKISKEQFVQFITSDTDNGKFLREIIEQGILAKESIEVMEEEFKDLVLEGII